jgi:hypothetical protein
VSLLDVAALVVSAAGVAVAIVAAATTGAVRGGLAAMLELWMAAGLLHLSAAPSWNRIATAAVVIAVRKLVVSALAHEAGAPLPSRDRCATSAGGLRISRR